jgi:hypothetical protein
MPEQHLRLRAEGEGTDGVDHVGERLVLGEDLQLSPRVRKLVRGLCPAASWLGSALFAVVGEEGCLVWSFVYLAVRNLCALIWLLARPRRSKELEILGVAP